MPICDNDNPIFWNTENELTLMGDMLKYASKLSVGAEMLDTLTEVKHSLDLLIRKLTEYGINENN